MTPARPRRRSDVVDAQLAHHLDAGVDYFVVGATHNVFNGLDDGIPRALRRGRAAAPHPRAGRPPPPERVGDANGAFCATALAERGRGPIPVAPRRACATSSLPSPPRVFVLLPPSAATFVPRPRIPPAVLRAADDGPLLRAVLPPSPAQHPTPNRAPRHGGRARGEGELHEAFGSGPRPPLRGWYPFEILHFSRCARSSTARAQVRDAVRGVDRTAGEGDSRAHGGGVYRPSHGRPRAAFLMPLVVFDDEASSTRPRIWIHVIDDRLRVRSGLGFGHVADAADTSFARRGANELAFSPPNIGPLGALSGSRSAHGSTRSSAGSRMVERSPLSRALLSALPGAAVVKRSGLASSWWEGARVRLLLFLLGLAVFAFEALGWPMAKGRDTWDYLAYPPLHASPPLPSELQLSPSAIAIVVELSLRSTPGCSRLSLQCFTRPRSSPTIADA